MRTFVAIELDEPCRRGLREALDVLKQAAGGVGWVKAESLHLTLKFIGELDERDVPRAVECLGQAAAGAKPFSMRVSGLSGFPPRGVPRVIHVEVSEPSGRLQSLQEAVDAGLADVLGIPSEARRFVAHITLGRVRDRSRCPAMDGICAAVPRQDFGSVDVDSMVLMRSDLRSGGAVYAPLHRFPLGKESGPERTFRRIGVQ